MSIQRGHRSSALIGILAIGFGSWITSILTLPSRFLVDFAICTFLVREMKFDSQDMLYFRML